MSNEVKEIDLNLDLAFLPAWAQESPEINRYANYEGEREDRRAGRGKGPRRDRFPGGPRSDGPRPERDRQPRERRDRDDRGPRGSFAKGKGGKGGGPRGNRPFPPKREELPPLALDINVIPENKGVDSLTKQIRMTGRAYPLFDIARLILQKEDRYEIELRTKKGPEGKPLQPLFVCVLDDSAWLTEEEAINHVLEKHLATFYQVEKTPTDPPKGTYTFVAQCGMSGIILGPPNYHDYQNKLHKLHQERFANMPFERFRSRVKIVREEEVVKKWIDEQSFKTEYVVLNVPEPVRLESWADVREHFRNVHLPNIVKSAERQLLPVAKMRQSGSRLIQRHVNQEIEQQRRFPLRMVTTLSQQFASRGLQFFKVNKTIVHVAVARPHFLDIETEPISEGVKKIVQFVNAHPRCTVKALVDALAPTAAAPVTPQATAPAPAAVEPSAEATTAEAAATPAPAAPEHHEPTPQQKAVLSELHWLVHSGHVIEFASGELETAKKPAPKPQPAPKKVQPEKKSETPAPAGETAQASAPAATEAPAEASEAATPAPEQAAPAPAVAEAPAPAPAETTPVAEAATAPSPETPKTETAADDQPKPPTAG